MIFGKRLRCPVGETFYTPEFPREGGSASFAVATLSFSGCETLEVSIQDRDESDGPWTDLAGLCAVSEGSMIARYGVVTRRRYRIRLRATGRNPRGHAEFVLAPPVWQPPAKREESQ